MNKETKRKEEELKKRKQMWEDECVRRMNSDPKEEVISFEDWDKERKEAEKKEEEKRKKEKREEEKRKEELRRKAREAERANTENNDNESDDELTPEELASLRGYKKTSDGRTTSYFNNELGEKEKELIGSIEPKRIDATPSPNSAADTVSAVSKVGSVWNQSGTTWEEKDTTEWCKSTLRKCLLDTTTAYYSTTSADRTYVAIVKKVKDMTGDASVALAGGKKRYIYDFHLGLDFEITDDDNNVVASSSLKLPDINSTTTAEEELEVDICAWTSSPGDVETDASECRKALVMDVRKSVVKFVELFNAEF